MMKFFLMAALIVLPICSFATYYSQYEQDQFVNENFFHNHRSGIFVDIGAHNGILISNTYFFEKELGWTGICVEPIPEIFAELQKNRRCICVQGCVTDHSGEGKLLKITDPQGHTEMLSGLLEKYDPRHIERIKREVQIVKGSYQILKVKCYLLSELLNQYGITHINFLSIDTEGGEFDILSTIDFNKYQIDVITVEDNYNDPRFIPFLAEKGFDCVGRKVCDLFFVNRNFRR